MEEQDVLKISPIVCKRQFGELPLNNEDGGKPPFENKKKSPPPSVHTRMVSSIILNPEKLGCCLSKVAPELVYRENPFLLKQQ